MADWNIDYEASVSWQNRSILRHNVLQIVFPIDFTVNKNNLKYDSYAIWYYVKS